MSTQEATAPNEPIVEMFGQVIRCTCGSRGLDPADVHPRDEQGARMPCPEGIAEPVQLLASTADGSLSIERRE